MNEDLDIDTGFFREQLERRLEELTELCESSADASKPVALDQSKVGRLSRMDALQGQAMAVETARRREAEIARIKAALARIDSDEYGYCLRCEEDIPQKRLASDPSATLCVECARK